ncbi:MAG: hypothetical protein HQK89_04590 [Nitrospirae bacterium]|nr:hypothetical protein [Nitrospirota bacterium]
MSYPLPDEYQEAIQNPAGCFGDYELKHGYVECNSIGLPRVRSGNFSSVYKVRYDDSQYAVKCFLNFSDTLQRRYAAISRYLAQAGNRYFVSFEFIPAGITVRRQKYPILKMAWVNGVSIDKYVSGCIAKGNTQGILAIRGWFINMYRYLRAMGIAHGDLQHGNLIVAATGLMLIDYDGTYVATMGIENCPEVGHPNYQHPKRSPSDFNARADRFSAIVIYTALTVLASYPSLWKKYYNGDNLLFSEKDYLNSNQSALFRELSRTSAPDIKILADVIASACVKPVAEIPDLLTLCDEINNVTAYTIEPAAWMGTWEGIPDERLCLTAGAGPQAMGNGNKDDGDDSGNENGNMNDENSMPSSASPLSSASIVSTYVPLQFKAICGGCGSENDGGAALCFHCGYPLTAPLYVYADETVQPQIAVNTVAGAEVVICPQCHGHNVEFAALCSHCGFLLSNPVPTPAVPDPTVPTPAVAPGQTIPQTAIVVKTPAKMYLGLLSKLKWGTVYFILFFFLMAVYDQTGNGDLLPFLVASVQASLEKAAVAWKKRHHTKSLKARHIASLSAIQACSKKIEARPLDPSLYEIRGKLYTDAGKYKQAIADLSTAIRLNPGLSSAYTARSAVYRMLGDERAALADVETAKKTLKNGNGKVIDGKDNK